MLYGVKLSRGNEIAALSLLFLCCFLVHLKEGPMGILEKPLKEKMIPTFVVDIGQEVLVI